uniref:BUB1 N-terminal domain-containing protein n=1 Tax=Angiostrongylus cantonensis TaxID=6313 RepID=A0A0K0DEY2_ANGCA
MSGGSSVEGSVQTTPFEFEWELCRENVKPLRSGRRVDAINQALAQNACGSKAESLANQQFDNMMKLCKDSNDPLKHCLEFCTWYAKRPEYIDDERMVRIWEKLADNSLDHGWEIYQHANTIGSLTRWSQDLEMRGAISYARAVLQRARRNGAVPLDAINSEEDRMEMRQIRRCLEERNDDDDSWNEDEYDENGKRVPFTRLAAMGDSSAAPVIRLPCIVGEQGSSKLDRGQRDQKSKRNQVNSFEVFEDHGDSVYTNLEDIFEMDNHIERFSLSDHDTEKWKASKVPLKKLEHCASNFTVWQDDNVQTEGTLSSKVVGSVVLKLKKLLIREMSIEIPRNLCRSDHKTPERLRKLNFFNLNLVFPPLRDIFHLEHLACMFESKQDKEEMEKIVRKIDFDEE